MQTTSNVQSASTTASAPAPAPAPVDARYLGFTARQWAWVLGIVGGVVLLSEIASNTATAVLLMPILAATAIAVGADTALLMFPAVLAASVGFMLPVATAPNAIAYGSGLVGSRDMLRHGAVLDAVGVVVLCGVCWVAFK